MSGEKRHRMSWRGWLILVFVLASMAVMLSTTALLFVGLLPTFAAFISGRDRERSATLSIGPPNLCGVMPFVILLWHEGHSMQGMLGIISQPFNLVVMYGAAAIGLAIYHLVPAAVVAVSAHQAEAQAKAQEEYLRALREMWGDEVAEE